MPTAARVAGRTVPGRTAPGRRLGAADGAALIVSNVVGIGIFTTPGIVAGLVGGPLPYLGVWLAGGVLALIGGLVYAELGGAYPEAGGEYVYIREAFGPAAAYQALKIGDDGRGNANATIAERTPTWGDYSVVVYASAANAETVVACGNLAPPAR